MTPDAPMFAAADRNKDAILNVLRDVLPDAGAVLEIASGGGQHLIHFARALPGLHWQPSEADPELVSHLETAVSGAALDNLRQPVRLDMSDADWQTAVPQAGFDAIYNANMIHIAPWRACDGLFAGAAHAVRSGGQLCLYGPFVVDGAYSSDGNRDFDRSLRAQNPEWGLRELADVCDVAVKSGFDHETTIEMPVNNLTVVFRRSDNN